MPFTNTHCRKAILLQTANYIKQDWKIGLNDINTVIVQRKEKNSEWEWWKE